MVTCHKMVMDKASPIPTRMINHKSSGGKRIAVAMSVFIAAAMLLAASCQRKPVMAHSSFVNLPLTGWQRTLPLSFHPEYDDSTSGYDLTLAVRHRHNYGYRNLSLVVDIIGQDSVVNRQQVEMMLADEYGNWMGGGFGTLYQDTVLLAHGLFPEDARTVVIWQAMEGCDTLHGLVNLGLIASPGIEVSSQ